MSKLKIECPACGQGWVFHMRVPKIGSEIYVCEECETTWMNRNDIGTVNHAGLMNYLQQHGLKGFWSEMEEIE